MDETIRSFTLDVPQAELDHLRAKLALVRWPETETAGGWTQGVPLQRAKSFIEYWRTEYDWRRCEAMLNGFGQFVTRLDGLDIHFLHVRSRHADALPLVMTHGWPGSVIEFHKVIAPLTDPTAFGGEASDAFHLVLPSLPGYGFSAKPSAPGWNVERIAAAWTELMKRLGYTRYVAQGGDWGAAVTTALAALKPAGLAAAHMNIVSARPKSLSREHATEEERRALDAMDRYHRSEIGYAMIQATRPQTLGYALADSPVGQAMWIYEKFQSWTDCDGEPENVLTRDEMLDDIMLYWLTNAAASSARLYWESLLRQRRVEVDLPVGFSVFPKELFLSPRHWAAEAFTNIQYWNEVERGGHFAAFEQPQLFVRELRACFRSFRSAAGDRRGPRVLRSRGSD
jgi:pimeloyl-ACP methyl ester carboxylesterase